MSRADDVFDSVFPGCDPGVFKSMCRSIAELDDWPVPTREAREQRAGRWFGQVEGFARHVLEQAGSASGGSFRDAPAGGVDVIGSAQTLALLASSVVAPLVSERDALATRLCVSDAEQLPASAARQLDPLDSEIHELNALRTAALALVPETDSGVTNVH